MLCNILLFSERELHCELLQSAPLWHADVQHFDAQRKGSTLSAATECCFVKLCVCACGMVSTRNIAAG